MTVESATYIDDLNAALPAAGDNLSEGDDHLRLIKDVLQNSFPNITGAVTVTHTQLNLVTTNTSDISTLQTLAGGNATDIAALEALSPIVGEVDSTGAVVGGTQAWEDLATPSQRDSLGDYTVNLPSTANWIIMIQRASTSGSLTTPTLTAVTTTSFSVNFSNTSSGADSDADFMFVAHPYT